VSWSLPVFLSTTVAPGPSYGGAERAVGGRAVVPFCPESRARPTGPQRNYSGKGDSRDGFGGGLPIAASLPSFNFALDVTYHITVRGG
jgi:hypothetical protein